MFVEWQLGYYGGDSLPIRGVSKGLGKPYLITLTSPTVTPINSVPIYANKAFVKVAQNPRKIEREVSLTCSNRYFPIGPLGSLQYLNPILSF